MAEPQPPPEKPFAQEPATARALWPTFMRRTLPADEIVQAAAGPERPHLGTTGPERLV